MTITTVMVHVDANQPNEGAVPVARIVADRFGATLVGVSALAIEPPFIAEGVIIKETTADDVAKMRAALAAKEAWFRDFAGAGGARVEWRSDIDFPTAFLVTQARSADLVVVSRQRTGPDRYNFLDPTEAMLRMGRPTLSVPAGVSELRADRIVIGWKDTREARRAVRDAIPFLAKASAVTIFEICLSSEQDHARHRIRDVARYLEHHGATCRTEVRVHMPEADSHQLLRLAAEEGADLIVTGGYGHSRLGEWMFGGMTRGLLDQAPVCLLMSH